jgi:hypothetical protein
VPEVIDGKPVRVVGGGGSAYLDSPGAKLTSVIIPASVRSIGDRAFWKSSNLSSVTIVEGVQTIGFAAFAYTGSLTNIVLPDSVKTLNGYAFYLATNLTGATLGAGLTSMGGTTGADFSNCRKLREIAIPNGVTSIPKLTFDSCASLANVVLPTGLTNIGLAAFAGLDMRVEDYFRRWQPLVLQPAPELRRVTIDQKATSSTDHQMTRGFTDEGMDFQIRGQFMNLFHLRVIMKGRACRRRNPSR